MRYYEDLIIGEILTAGDYRLEQEEMLAFARRWDPQPFHVDPEAARLTPMGGLTASSAHTYAISALLLNRIDPPIAGIGSLRHQLDIPHAARPGDILTLNMSFSDKRVSVTKPDRGLVTTVCELRNQTGKVVMRIESLMMVHCRPPTT